MRPFRKYRQRSGVAIILTTLTLLVFIPMVGLAIDGAIMYYLKLRMSQAVDAGVLAGARSLSRGESIEAQAANAKAIAERFFDANFPSTGFWGTFNVQRDAQIFEETSRLRRVNMTASADAPLYFMRVLGHDSAEIGVSGEAHRRDVNIMMVLDRSGSLNQAGACDDLRDAARSFANKFSVGRDRLGLLTFNGATTLDTAPSMTFKPDLIDEVDSIRCGGWTNMSQALWNGYQELVSIDDQGALNVILFFTDGRPTALTALWDVKQAYDTRMEPWSPYQNRWFDPSACQDAAGNDFRDPGWWPQPKIGFIAANALGFAGPTVGLYNHLADATGPVFINQIDRLGCNFNSSERYVRLDISHIPETDLFGNITANDSYKTVPRFPGGHPYAGMIRVDSPGGLRNAAYNATDNAALRVRQDEALKPVIYVIGLGDPTGTLAETPDAELMNRMANTPESAIYDRTKQTGLYIFAPGPEQLTEAFLRVASEILRLAF